MVSELYIYGGAYGLPSIDAQCLAMISYLSIVSHQEYTIVECNDPAVSPSGQLPMLHDGNNWIAGTNRIISYLSKTGYNADEDLSAEDLAKSVAYSALADESLADAILFSWFADTENFFGATRKAYSNLFSFPSRYILPTQMRKSAVRRVQKYGHSVTIDSEKSTNEENTRIYDLARDCYRVLDRKLGDKDFFFGLKPTSLDAKVFAYLAVQLYPEIPNPQFQLILINQFPRLVAYCDRCREEFFANPPDITLPSEPSPFFTNPISAPREWFRNTFFFHSTTSSSRYVSSGNEKPKKTKEDREFDLKRIYAITFGVVAMATYAIVNGLVAIGNEEEEDEREEHKRSSSE
ncbi:metaxin 1 [Entomortierella chlamydospora]|nr:metaxin 1 [Entomortierella chlamydospora]